MRRAIWWRSLGLRLLGVGLIILGASFDLYWFSGSTARQARGALGRTVVIEGNLDVDSTWPPLIQAEQVRVANAAWSKEPSM